MISKAKIKEIKSLHLPKFRQIYNKFVVEGGKACAEFIKKDNFIIEAIYVTEVGREKYQHLQGIERHNPLIIASNEMNQISAMKTPTDIFLVVQKKEDSINFLTDTNLSAIYLDDVQDPGNVGTIIRIADWFGIHAVIRSPESADFFNPKVVQATMGSLTNVRLATSSFAQLMDYQRPIVGTYMEGASIYETIIPTHAILVMGNEGKGIHQDHEQYITNKIYIPGASNRVADSLNVAIATGIVCAWWQH